VNVLAIIRLHLNSGQTVECRTEDTFDSYDYDLDEELAPQVADDFREELNTERPRWISVGNTVAFSGAVSALEVLDAEIVEEEGNPT